LTRIKRYSTKPFPPYRFLPGVNPHPIENPRGHSFGKESEKFFTTPLGKWQENESYLYAVDLYNDAFWWESHEALEGLWRKVPREKIQGQFLQGLIKISAAFLKWTLRERRGVIQHYDSAMKHLCFVSAQEPFFWGIHLPPYLDNLEQHFNWIRNQSTAWSDPLENYPFIHLEGIRASRYNNT